MPDHHAPKRTEIPEELMLRRLAQSEEMRDFFIQMWLQNPQLARQGGEKVRSLLSPMKDRQVNPAVKSERPAGAPQSGA